jgi:hypothetical protein
MEIFRSKEALEATKSHFLELKKKKDAGEYRKSLVSRHRDSPDADGELVEPKNETEWARLAEDEAIEALAVFTVLNDLGKVESVVQLVRARTAVEEVDHDKILWMGNARVTMNLINRFTNEPKIVS